MASPRRGRGAAGSIHVDPAPDRTPSVKVVDGDPSDWIGDTVGLGGAITHSAGELIYEDFVFDAHGADDGIDSLVDAVAKPLVGLIPDLDRALRAGPVMAGVLLNGYLPGSRAMHMGDARTPTGRAESADLVEARIAAADDGIFVLARTGQMHTAGDTAVLVLVDLDGANATRTVPFGSRLATTRADLAIYLANNGSEIVDLRDGTATPVDDVAVNADGFTNAIEARIPLPVSDTPIGVALAIGYSNGDGGFMSVGPNGAPNVVNVAFRSEDVTVAMERTQAFMLQAGRIDAAFTTVDLAALAGGVTEAVTPGPGYYEASFVSTTPGVANEDLPRQGAFQHYALYLPKSWTPGASSPTTLWLHYGAGDTHHLGAFQAGLVRELGEARDNVLIGPSGRGAYSFYRGAGYADVMEVMADSMRFGRDLDRTTVAGYSMGSYGAMMLTALHPDMFAGALGMDGTPPSRFDGWTENRANSAAIPFVLMAGLSYPDVEPDYQALVDAGGTARLYLYPIEHFSNVILDVWSELTSALCQPVRNLTPAHVHYTRVPAIEEGAATMPSTAPMVQTNPATVDATTDGNGHQPARRVPESGLISIGAVLPFVMEGVRYDPVGELTPPAMSFDATFTNVASVRLDMEGMGLCAGAEATGTIDTDGPATVTLERPAKSPVVIELPAVGDHVVKATC